MPTQLSSRLPGSGKKNYLVTGAAGFIGYRLGRSLTEQGHRVIAVDLKTHFEERRRTYGEHGNWSPPEIWDREELFAILPSSPARAEADGKSPETKAPGRDSQASAPRSPSRLHAQSLDGIDGIIHLGACANTMETRKDYLDHVNLHYSQRLWHLAIQKRIPFVYASSAATYGDGTQGYSDDESQIRSLRPLNLYGQSKQDFDLWILKNESEGYAPPAWSGFKFFNVYGFGEGHKGAMASVVYHWVKQIQAKGVVRLFRSHREGIPDGHQKRDFVSVEDVVRVLLFALEKPVQRGIYNLGTGRAETYLDLANAVFAAMGRPPSIEFVDTPIEIREKYQYFTEARLQKLRQIGYQTPFLSLKDGVTQYVQELLRAPSQQ